MSKFVTTPIVDSVPPRKQSVKRHFGSHPYFTRRPWNVVQAYIKHFAPNPQALVLDPFGGSGVTAIEAIVLGQQGIHVDLNPLSNFICQQIAIAPVDISALRNTFLKLTDVCRDYINHIYSLSLDAVLQEKERAWYPTSIDLPKNADAPKIENLFTRRQQLSLGWLYHNICQIRDATIRDLMRFAFSATLNKCNLTYSTTKGRSEGRGNSGIMHTYRYWLPQNPVELNVWNEFQQKFKNLLAVKKETNQVIGRNYERLRILHGSATQLTNWIEEASVDYIFTDPPYGSHIAYLDLSTMWNAWLGFDVSVEDKKLEAIEGGDLDKSLDEYARLLQESMEQMQRVLKKDAWLSIVFAHKDLSYWNVLIEGAQDAGFEYANTVVQESFQFSRHKRANPNSVLSGELILNLRKKTKPRRIQFNNGRGGERQVITEQVEHLLSVNELGLATEDLFNRLIPRLLEHGLLKSAKTAKLLDIQAYLQETFYFDPESSRWFISPNVAVKGRELIALQENNGQLSLGLK